MTSLFKEKTEILNIIFRSSCRRRTVWWTVSWISWLAPLCNASSKYSNLFILTMTKLSHCCPSSQYFSPFICCTNLPLIVKLWEQSKQWMIAFTRLNVKSNKKLRLVCTFWALNEHLELIIEVCTQNLAKIL